MKFQKGRIYSDRVDQWLPGAKGREEEINCITGLLKDNFQKKKIMTLLEIQKLTVKDFI